MHAPASPSPPRWIGTIADRAQHLQSDLVATRRYLHQHPELSDAEFQTTEYLVGRIRDLQLPVHVAGEGRGLTTEVASPTTGDPLPWFAIRGDIDALPIQDIKSVDYRSLTAEVMHACGHDAHTTICYGALRILAEMQAAGELPWPIAVRGIFQPAEETSTGAPHMIHHHALRDVTHIIALHVDPTRAVGTAGLRLGTLTAACDQVYVRITGRGGHGARPHLTADPIDAATRWVQSAYRRLARAINPHQTVVFSVGSIHAGHSGNVIPNSAQLEATLRSLDTTARGIALETLEDIGEAVHRETGCGVELTLGTTAPAVHNDDGVVRLLERAVKATLGPGAIEWIDEPSMGSEDFSFYVEHVPGAMFRLGIAGDQVGRSPLHTPEFDIDERALTIGAQLMAAAAIFHFQPPAQPSVTANA